MPCVAHRGSARWAGEDGDAWSRRIGGIARRVRLPREPFFQTGAAKGMKAIEESERVVEKLCAYLEDKRSRVSCGGLVGRVQCSRGDAEQTHRACQLSFEVHGWRSFVVSWVFWRECLSVPRREDGRKKRAEMLAAERR